MWLVANQRRLWAPRGPVEPCGDDTRRTTASQLELEQNLGFSSNVTDFMMTYSQIPADLIKLWIMKRRWRITNLPLHVELLWTTTDFRPLSRQAEVCSRVLELDLWSLGSLHVLLLRSPSNPSFNPSIPSLSSLPPISPASVLHPSPSGRVQNATFLFPPLVSWIRTWSHISLLLQIWCFSTFC